jgi:hypothetical protein
MAPWDEEPWEVRGNYTAADAAADLAAYSRLKRTACVRSAILIIALALLLTPFTLWGAFALTVGGICGITGALLLARGNERLVDRGNVRSFVLSSFLRIAVFAIVPVGLAVRGPVWSMALYFAGYFTPVLFFAAAAPRAFERKKE